MLRRGIWAGTLLLLLIGHSSCTARQTNPLHTTQFGKEPTVRVQLTRHTRVRSGPIAIEGPFEFRTSDRVVARGSNLSESRLRANGDSFGLGGRSWPGPLLQIVPERNGKLRVGERWYRGSLFIHLEQGRLTFVNHVSMEDYLAGVIGCEMSLSWPDAALEAQAICARTYALHEMTNHTRNLFDVYDTVRSQVYRGVADRDDRAIEIVNRTRGLVLTYQGRVFSSYFSSTCGGHTSSAEIAFGGSTIPPLSGRPCEACKISKYYRWSHSFEKGTIEKKLLAAGAPLSGKLTGVQVVDRGPSGHAKTVALIGSVSTSNWSATRFRHAVGPGTKGLLSTRFEATDRGASIEFKGGGWGHGVGLCQMGTLGLAQDGIPADRICRYYYPGAMIRRLW